MRKVYIKDLKVSDVLLNHNFAVKEFTKKKGKTGKEYFNVVLADKTGQVSAKVWGTNFNDVDQNVKTGDVVSVTGRVDEFLEKPQVIIEKLVLVKDFDPSDFLLTGGRDLDEIWSYIQDKTSSLDDTDIKKAISKVFEDKKIVSLYKQVPAGEIVHHNYVGGLLEHVYEMLIISESVPKLYSEANYSELFMGILFHDVGKVEEYVTTGVTLERSKSGYFLGHMAQGILLLEKLLPEDFPQDTKDRLYHMILSHHGEKEKGSPVQPMTLEAILLSQIDEMSSKAGIYYAHIKNEDPDDKGMVGYSRYLGSSILHHDY